MIFHVRLNDQPFVPSSKTNSPCSTTLCYRRCVDLMYKTPEADSSGPSTSYSQPSSRPPGKRTKPRAAKPSQSDYFWSAYEEYETDEDFTFTRFSRGAQYRPRDARRRESERTYGFRGTSPMDDNVTFEDWEDFEAFIREHVRKREWEARRAEETEKVRKEQKRKEREREREKERQEREARPRGGREARTEKEAKAKRATSPDEWRGPASECLSDPASFRRSSFSFCFADLGMSFSRGR